MRFEISCRSSGPETRDAVGQMDDAYGVAFMRTAEKELTLSRLGGLSIFLKILHPAWRVPGNDGRGSYYKPTNAYLMWQSLDYADWIAPDWEKRTLGYARSVTAAIARIAKTRLTEDERRALLKIADRTATEIAGAPPETIIPLEQIHLVYGADDPVPKIGFGTAPGLGAFCPPGETYAAVSHKEALTIFLSLPVKKPALPDLPRIHRRDGGTLHFYEAFPVDNEIVEHWGIAGQSRHHAFHPFASPQEATSIIAKLKKEKRDEGFRPVPRSKQARLIVEYPVTENFADRNELDFRHEAENYLDDLLGRMGLGYCDGGSSGLGTMEICNFVVDFKLAEAVIKRELAGTAFNNYSRIYLER